MFISLIFKNKKLKAYQTRSWSARYSYCECFDLNFWNNWEFTHFRVIRISPFANRLSFDAPPAVQRLRCLANYKALRFANPILSLGEILVARMRERSASNGGKYISVHLRFEEVCFEKLNVFWVYENEFMKTCFQTWLTGYGCVLVLYFRWWT